MVNEFVRHLELLLNEIEVDLLKSSIQAKKFFGGAAGYVNDRIFVSLTKIGLAVKVANEQRDQLMKQGGKELRYFARGHVKKEYALLPNYMMNDIEKLTIWINNSIRYVSGGIVS